MNSLNPLDDGDDTEHAEGLIDVEALLRRIMDDLDSSHDGSETNMIDGVNIRALVDLGIQVTTSDALDLPADEDDTASVDGFLTGVIEAHEQTAELAAIRLDMEIFLAKHGIELSSDPDDEDSSFGHLMLDTLAERRLCGEGGDDFKEDIYGTLLVLELSGPWLELLDESFEGRMPSEDQVTSSVSFRAKQLLVSRDRWQEAEQREIHRYRSVVAAALDAEFGAFSLVADDDHLELQTELEDLLTRSEWDPSPGMIEEARILLNRYGLADDSRWLGVIHGLFPDS